MNNKRTPRIAVAAILLLAALALPAILSAAFKDADIQHFTTKCGKCHKWHRATKHLAGASESKIDHELHKMQKKDPAWLSEADIQAIYTLFTTNDIAEIDKAAASIDVADTPSHTDHSGHNHTDGEHAAAADTHDDHDHDGHGEENEFAETLEHSIKYIHGAWNGIIFLVLGLYMSASGLRRFREDKLPADAPRTFDWKAHVARGKLYVVCVLVGLCGGLAIWALDGFHAGDAAPHFFAGITVAALYSAGGAIGLKLAKGQARNLKTLHMVLNLAATALFLFMLASGLYMLLGD